MIDASSDVSRLPVARQLLNHCVSNGTFSSDRMTRTIVDAWSQCHEQVGMGPMLPILFNLKGRPYSLKNHQPMEPMFKTSQVPRRSVLKCGRQVSKCCRIGGLGHVLLHNGRRVLGTDLKVGDKLLSLDDSSLKVVTSRVSRVFKIDPKPGLRIITRLGSVLDVATTHPIRTPLGYTQAGHLAVGQRLASARRTPGLSQVEHQVSDARIGLTAFMIGDGCCGLSSNFSFTSAGEAANKLFTSWVSDSGPEVLRATTKEGGKACQYSVSTKHPLKSWLVEDGLWGHYSWDKHLPSWVFDLSKRQAQLFVSCLWSTDGMVKPRANGVTISYCSTSRALAYDLRSLLLKFGIISSIKKHATTGRDAYILRVEGSEAQQLFCQEFDVPDKPSGWAEFPAPNSNRDTLPLEFNDLVWSLCDQAAYARGNSLRRAGLRRKPKYALSRRKAGEYIAWLSDHGVDPSELSKINESDIYWDEVAVIEKLPAAPCWDIEVETHHNYLLDGVVCHNSTVLAYQGLAQSIFVPYFNTLYVTPLYEQVRRFSQNYMRQAMETCRIREQIRERGSSENVLQRAIANGSNMFFSFAFTDCERTRGINSDAVKYDEVQGIDKSFIPVINESMSASEYRLQQFSGTPLTKDNTIEDLWTDSSMAEWAIKCSGCQKTNLAGFEYDLMKMIGKNGLICAKCGKALNTREGYWLHTAPHLRLASAGYHQPQVIFPMHCQDPERWAELLRKREKQPEAIFMNECLGESWDSGARLVTQTQLQAACTLNHRNNLQEAVRGFQPNRHVIRMLAIDWSGGGSKEESLNAMAVLGLLPDGRIELIFEKVRPHRIDHTADAHEAMGLFDKFLCHYLVHDYTGAGANREHLLITMGFPFEKIIPMSLARTAGKKELVSFNPQTNANARSSYTLDKSRSLVFTCELIKAGYLAFPKWSSCSDDLKHFLALAEETLITPRGADLYLITKAHGVPDDLAQAVNMGVCAIYYQQQKWPDLLAFVKQQSSRAMEDAIGPS